MSQLFVNPRDPENREITRLIKTWVISKAGLKEDDVVHVSQITCNDPGCLGAETHILILFASGAEKKHIKILKPLVYVRERDVDQWFLNKK